MSKIYIFLLRSDGKQLNINKGLTKVIMILYMQQGRTLRGPLKTLTDLMYSTYSGIIHFPTDGRTSAALMVGPNILILAVYNKQEI